MSEWQTIHNVPNPDLEQFLITDGSVIAMGFMDDDGDWLYHDYPDCENMYQIRPTHWGYPPQLPGKD